MTSAQQTQLDAAWSDYTAKKADYESKLQQYNGVKGTQFEASAKTRLDAAKVAMDNSLAAYNTLKDTIAQQEQAAFNLANPSAAVAIAQSQAQAAADAAAATAAGKKAEAETLAKAQLEAQNQAFAAKNKQYILVSGIVLVVVVVGVFIYLKVKKAA